jgi:hypothetical protein
VAREIRQVVAELDAMAPPNPDDLNLDRLQELADEYFALADAPTGLDVWFRLFERFPEADGNGIFWSILHNIETQSGYRRLMVESIRRRASRFPILMVNRLLNGGVRSVGVDDLALLLATVAADEQALPSARADARSFLEQQQSEAPPGTSPDSIS